MIKINDKQKTNIKNLKFIDLFAGIGGFHLALNSFDSKCVYSSEWDKHSQRVYEKNFKIKPDGDITLVNEKKIPVHDILCGGFPCQAFSISGKQKGFEDSRGTLFFDIARIAKHHQPKLLFLENVYNLERHDNGKTLKTILSVLDDIGYTTFTRVLNASHYGVPQIRKRIFFVCFRKDLKVTTFKFPKPINTKNKLINFMENNVDPSMYLDENKLINLKLNKIKEDVELDLDVEEYIHSIRLGSIKKGGQGDRIYSIEGAAITLSAYGGGTGSKTGLYKTKEGVRKLTPRECANISGFPKNFILHENKNQSYKQFGNSVVVDVLQHILIEVNKVI
jgi:DNA (cytosine-5)-methyltransferase 1